MLSGVTGVVQTWGEAVDDDVTPPVMHAVQCSMLGCTLFVWSDKKKKVIMARL